MRIKGQDKHKTQKQHIEKDCPQSLADISAEELALHVQNGSQESFMELVRRYESRLLIFMKYKTGNTNDAEDLVQETFLKAYFNIHKYSSSFKFSTWLFTIASHLAASQYRKLKPNLQQQETVDDNNPLNEMIEKESSCGLLSLAAALPDNQYQVLWLKYIEDMPIKEISKVVGKSQINVKVILYRARMNLAGKLKVIKSGG
jgi:RNA polymerase sigma-70 factor, ECF subfamily